MNALTRKFALAIALVGGISLAGCASGPYGNNGYNSGSRGQQSGYYGNGNGRCQSCGVVKEVQQVYTDGNSGNSGNGGTLGAIIGAVAGGVLGNTVGKGDGRKAATVAGAVAGGVVGNQVGKRSGNGNGNGSEAWRIVVRLDNGQYVTVTQRNNPGIRSGDYVEVRNNQVYAR